MEPTLQDILDYLNDNAYLGYIGDKAINALLEESSMQTLIPYIKKDNLHWKTNVENLIGLYLDGHYPYWQYIYEMLTNNPTSALEAFSQNGLMGNSWIIEAILKSKKLPEIGDFNESLQSAVIHGQTDIVRLLLSDDRVDPSIYDNMALLQAVRKGHAEIVKLLLLDKRVDPSVYDNVALEEAVLRRQTETAKLLLLDKSVQLLAILQ